ncbi:MAG: hypothetical protein ABSA67_17270 [Candidatus Brocadiia bacterium]
MACAEAAPAPSNAIAVTLAVTTISRLPQVRNMALPPGAGLWIEYHWAP